MDDIHEELKKEAKKTCDDNVRRVAEIFAEQMKIGVGIDPIDVEEGDPAAMLDALMRVENDR